MQDILNQLGELVLGSIPTICLFFILLAAYAVLVRGPLAKVLADRHARTGGAMDEAHKAIAASEAKTAEYEKKLRDARAKIFEARAARQKQSADAREQAVAAARSSAQQHIAAARKAVEQSGAEARQQIEQGAEALSQQIVAAILPNRSAGQTGAQA